VQTPQKKNSTSTAPAKTVQVNGNATRPPEAPAKIATLAENDSTPPLGKRFLSLCFCVPLLARRAVVVSVYCVPSTINAFDLLLLVFHRRNLILKSIWKSVTIRIEICGR
jgi:hypothetical protein